MALKDMKSDLSKFRMPKKEPLQSKERVDVNKNLNKTPLSSMAESAPKIPRSTTTVNKEGVNPQKVNQSEKFKGETSPQPMDNSEKFLGETTTKPMSLEERYLGQTDPTKANNSEQFLGETTPKSMNNQSQFLGETTPKQANNKIQFLGETTPKQADNESKFLGETTPNESDRSSKFLGETTPTEANNQSQFLGETTPTEMNNQSNFLGETTPNESDRSSKFLGETTPNEMNNQSQFLGETTPLSSDRSSKFLGETTPTPMNIPNGENELGETTPTDFSFKKKLENEGKDFKEVNYFQDIHSKGFTSRFGGVEASKFVGVNPNNTVFDSTNSLYSNPNNFLHKGKFTLGSTYSKSFNDVAGLNSGEEGFGLGKGHAQRKSPSFLDEMYSKFNLKDDSFNRGLGLFRQPFILRGIQRRKVSKGEPQVWGLGGFNYDEGAIRGGIVTSTVRALIDVARIGSWFASVPGILWGAKQFGMQRQQQFGKVWTPVNMLAAIGGQHIGLKPMRAGLIPLDDPTTKYGTILKGYEVAENAGFLAKKAATILAQYDTLDIVYGKTVKGFNFKNGIGHTWKSDKQGGFNSLYGINITGPSEHRRYVNTFANQSKDNADEKAKYKQKFNPLTATMKTGDVSLRDTYVQEGSTFEPGETPIGKDIVEEIGSVDKVSGTDYLKRRYFDSNEQENPDDFAGRKYDNEVPYRFTQTTPSEGTVDDFAKETDLGLNANNLPASFLNNKIRTEDGDPHNLEKKGSDTELTIRDYETIAYGNIPKRGTNDGLIDFRSLLTGNEKKRSEISNYKENRLEVKSGFNTPGLVGADRTDYTKDTTRFDAVQALRPVATKAELKNDLVKFYLQPISKKDTGDEFYQFRGTVNGITETFSPSWDSLKFSGRADQGYKYSSFERSVSFNFKMWATSRTEMKPMYEKLEALSTFTMPLYRGSKAYQGILVKMTLGDLYVDKLTFIESLSYSFPDEAPWDVNLDGSDLGVRPMGIDISIGFKILDDVRPEYKAQVYDLGWR